MSTLHIHFEPNRQQADRESLARLLAADAAYSRGEMIEADEHVTFESLEMLFAALTPRRLELVRHLAAKPAASIRALAGALGRDYSRVHGDVKALRELGLIAVADDGSLRAQHSEIRFSMSLAHAAA